ncbi:Uncharacterised protein [Serratia fonticola]|uniref:hypothetical protein n=1 Tax=Serratia fonticola TaxID=47917 RepID=UPI002183B2AF|nr:hypothetical protein [Serratia fonticola]CAI2121938.1 Uncharacterised protein [Serratia fonticola]
MKGINVQFLYMSNKFALCILTLLVLLLNPAYAKNWYQGGTLHEANAIEWQNAKQENKLATSADFIAGIYSKGLLVPEISNKIKSVDDFKPYAVELTNQLDAAFERDPNPAQNKKTFTNQSVKSTAMMLMIVMAWVEN